MVLSMTQNCSLVPIALRRRQVGGASIFVGDDQLSTLMLGLQIIPALLPLLLSYST